MRRWARRPYGRPGAFATILVLLVVVGSAAPSWATPGTVLWTKRFNSPISARDQATALATSPDGTKVFVTGTSPYGNYNGFDYATIAYNTTTGAPVWTKYYNGPNDFNDYAKAITVSPDGSKVFITGSSQYSDANCVCTDYATQALNATTGATLWTQRYHSAAGQSDAVAIAPSPDGTKVYVTGSTWNSATHWDFVTFAYSAATGGAVWTKRYNSPGNREDQAAKVGASPDGTKVFVTGLTRNVGGGGADYATVAYSAVNGTPLWAKTYASAGIYWDEARSLAVSPNSSTVFVTGYSSSATGGNDFLTFAYNTATGAVVWSKFLNSSGNGTDQAYDLRVSPDGSKVFVMGQSTNSSNSTDYLTAAYRATDGALLWAARYDGPVHKADSALAIAVSPDGNRVYVTGASVGRTGCSTPNYCEDYATVAYGTVAGAVAWTKRYDGPADGPSADAEDVATAVGVSPGNGKVFVTGSSVGATSPARGDDVDYATIAYSTL